MRRRWVIAAILLAGVLAAWHLGLAGSGFVPGAASWRVVGRFLGAALAPTLTSQSDLAAPLLPRVLLATWNTVVFAAAAMSLALPVGSLLGLLASERWWGMFPVGRAVGPVLHGSVRILIAFLRSIHEILWALALLAAFGLHPVAAVLAIAIPYAGTLAKVFSELIDEAPGSVADALRAAGAGPLQVFSFGLLPHALPDIGAYALYRFECALRSAAVLGFFGFGTLGKLIYEAVGELHFQEAWTFLYALLALVLAVEAWSAALRQRLTIA